MLNTAVRAARAAGDIIVRAMDRLDRIQIDEKSTNDFVSDVDRRSEREIIDIIHKAYPQHGILAEESGLQAGDEYQWIIDPLDGTTNYLHGIPHFAVSIAVSRNDVIEQGVVFDPVKSELFTASRGSGAQLDGKRIRVSDRTSLKGALLATGFPFGQMAHLEEYVETMRALMPLTAGLRRAGSAALDLAYVAAGRFDGFWEFRLQPWDVAAGSLLIQEAGGIVCGFDGSEDFMSAGSLVGAPPKVLRELMPHMPAQVRTGARASS
ncbi:MAG: inositol monophosphatase family protein [Gammaproteobacteria bacterium]